MAMNSLGGPQETPSVLSLKHCGYRYVFENHSFTEVQDSLSSDNFLSEVSKVSYLRPLTGSHLKP